MKFYKPQLQLARTRVFDAPDEFVLHAVTFCRLTNFRADGYTVDEEQLDDGILSVTLRLRQDPDLPDLEYITPVVHTIPLGPVAFPDDEGEIVVDIVGVVLADGSSTARIIRETTAAAETTTTASTTKTGGQATVSTTDADDKSRPSKGDKLS